ncbi:hypothetical protein AAMO2058_001352600 [Amorphochlora amoebiformis]
MDEEKLIAVIYLVTILALIVGFLFLRKRLSKITEPEDEQEEDLNVPVRRVRNERKTGKKKKKRRGLNRIRSRIEQEEDDDEAESRAEEKRIRQDEVRQRQRRAMRQMEEDKAASKRKKETAYQAKLAAKREKREAERLAREREEAEKKKKKKEDEEALYEQWAGEIEMEAEGTEVLDAEATESLMAAFVDYIKKYKVVVLDDLATEFEMKTKSVVERITDMEKVGSLSGIMDESGGKYIYITEQEMKKVVDYMMSKGRVSIDDIVDQSNKLIDLQGTA